MNHRRNNRGQRGEHRSVTLHLHSRQMNFRLLCHVDTAGGVIGNNGTRVKHLENQTGCRILLEKPLRNCLEQVINVTGDAAVEKNISINDDRGESEVVHVSAAQEGLLRVFERVLELEGNGGPGDGAVGCRLLGRSFQIRALIGKGGETIDAIRRISGAKIKFLNKEQLPACAATDEELIQIMGGILSVKRALVPVSQYLQDCATGRRPASMASGMLLNENRADFSSQPASLMPFLLHSAVDHSSVGHSVSKYSDKVLSLDEENAQQRVVFRLFCSSNSARGVTGLAANFIHALENETGASIRFSPPVHGSKDRVAIISSLEKRDPLYPSAQTAVIRVFEKSMEVALDCGLISGLCKGAIVSAKILVASDELKCLFDEKGKIGTDIGSTSGVEIQLSPTDLLQNLVAENDKVIQIVGEYFNVKVALFQVTGKLRENFFSSLVSKGVAFEQHPSSSMPKTCHNEGQLNLAPKMDHVSDSSFPVEMDHLRFVPNLGGPHKLLWNKQINDSVDVNGVTETVEIVIPEQKFGCVYGWQGTSLTKLKEISGAEITVQDPHPSENSGKVIISGTSEQIQLAKCLLQAFICIQP